SQGAAGGIELLDGAALGHALLLAGLGFRFGLRLLLARLGFRLLVILLGVRLGLGLLVLGADSGDQRQGDQCGQQRAEHVALLVGERYVIASGDAPEAALQPGLAIEYSW